MGTLDGPGVLAAELLVFVQVTGVTAESGGRTMGLMDKVKAQATVLAEKAQETARDSKAKYDQAQAKRHGDVLLRNLGAVVYAERTGRGAPDSAAEADRLIADIRAHEAQNGLSLAPETGTGPSEPGAPGGPGGSSDGGPDEFPPEADTTTQV